MPWWCHLQTAMSNDYGQTRRTVLRTAGATIAGIGGATAVAGASNEELSRVHMVLGTVNSPISRDVQERVRERAISAYRREKGEDPKRAGRVHNTDNNPVVGYAVGFDDNGTPHYMSVKTPDPADVGARHSELKQRVRNLKSRMNSPGTMSETQSVSTASSSWEYEMGIYAGGGTNNDAGSIDHEIDVYRLTEDGVSDGETFAAVQIMTTEPGVYSNLSGDTLHDWSPADNSPGTESNALVDYGPEQAFSGDGDQTAYLSARNTTLSWTWTHNGDVTTDTDTSANEADQFLGDFTQSYGGGTGDNEEQLGCGTAVETNQPSSGFYDIVTLTAEETFFYASGSVYDEETVVDEQTVNMDYEYL